jgi:hypothetical protein
MDERYLFMTAIPILLDGGRLAARVARDLYIRHGLEVHWFGQGWRPLLAIYAHKHPSLPFEQPNDRVTVRLLKAFAKERAGSVGIPTLIPCTPAAEAFLARVREELEEDFTLLEMPDLLSDPIRGLLRSEP